MGKIEGFTGSKLSTRPPSTCTIRVHRSIAFEKKTLKVGDTARRLQMAATAILIDSE